MATSEDRIGKFLKRLLERRSALEIAQSLTIPEPPHVSRIPGGSSISLSAVNKRWGLIPHSEESRRALMSESAEAELASYENHIENCIGAVKIPVGIAGPLRVRGIFASGDYYVPMATTEAALVASYSRGAQVISEAGGCVSVMLNEGVSRTPGFAFRSLVSAGLFAVWCIEHRDELRKAAAQTTAYGELADIGVAIEGNHVYLLLEFTTGDASGQNMVTIATQAVCNYIGEHSPLQPEYSFVEANFSGDKKATALCLPPCAGRRSALKLRCRENWSNIVSTQRQNIWSGTGRCPRSAQFRAAASAFRDTSPTLWLRFISRAGRTRHAWPSRRWGSPAWS